MESWTVTEVDRATHGMAEVQAALAGGTATLRVTLPDDPALIKAVRHVLEALPAALADRLVQPDEARIERLLDSFVSELPESRAFLDLEADNARARAALLRDHVWLTSAEVARLAGHAGKNAALTANRWKLQGRVLAVTQGGRDLFPAFQFREGQPHSAVAEVLAALPADRSPWQRAFWFLSPNGWLGGALPAERLEDAAALAAAARREGEPIIG